MSWLAILLAAGDRMGRVLCAESPFPTLLDSTERRDIIGLERRYVPHEADTFRMSTTAGAKS
jgi:hypothetical protein